MEYRKRARLEIASTQNGDTQGVTGNGDNGIIGTTALATIGGQSYLLSGHQVVALTSTAGQNIEANATLPANILLTICDENSEEEPQELIVDSSLLTQIKQEHNVATQTSPLPLQLPSPQVSSIAPPMSQSSLSSQANCLMSLSGQYHLITNTNINKNNNKNNTSEQQQQYVGQHKAMANNSNTILLNTPTGCDTNMCTTAAAAATANFLTNAVQLPPGCEIYLLKEFLDVPMSCSTSLTHIEINSDGAEVETNDRVGQNASNITTGTSAATIKMESDLSQVLTSSNAANVNVQKLQQQEQQQHSHVTRSYDSKFSKVIAITHPNNGSVAGDDDMARSNCMLETHKKRDDKRRATHNEVERRRRDKINSWIFKLKEMLPTDMNVTQQRPIQQQRQQHTTQNERTAITMATPTIRSSTSAPATAIAKATIAIRSTQNPQPQQSLHHNSARTPPNDSKSQILIKACEYIKCMQDEIKSLQQCLKENESLRLCNKRLQEELYYLRHKQVTCENNETKECEEQEELSVTTTNIGTIAAKATTFGATELHDIRTPI